MKKVKYTGLVCMLTSMVICGVTLLFIAPNWIFLTVLPLAILILAFFNTVAGGSTALVISLFSLIFFIGRGDLAQDLHNAMIGVSSLFLVGAIFIVYHAVKAVD